MNPMKSRNNPSSRMNVIRTILIAVPIIAASLFFKLASGEGKLLYFAKEDPSSIKASFLRFTDTKSRKIGLKPGDRLIIQWDEEEKRGSLHLEIRDPEGFTLKTLTHSEDDYQFIADTKGNYQLYIVGEGAQGSFDLRWDYHKAEAGN